MNGDISLTSREGNFLCVFYFVGKKITFFGCNAARPQSFWVIVSINDPTIITSNMVSKMESSISSYVVQRKILKVGIVHIL